MPVDYGWGDDAHTIMRLSASGSWNWRDFHKAFQRSIMRMFEVTHPIDVIIDLRGSDKLPAGAVGHVRSLGKSMHVNMPPRLIMIGVDEALQAQLNVTDGVYQTKEALIRFVEDDEAAMAVLREWRGED